MSEANQLFITSKKKSTEEYGANVQRPAYSVLSKEKISKSLKIKIPAWQVSLEKFIKNERFNPL